MTPLAPCLMVQGTGSGVGKSLLATAFCRIFSRAGYRVAPFKAQNMSLNAAVTIEGGEIGRAQAAQAEAASIEPTVDMNPILLKPESETRSQVVVRGVAVASVGFRDYGAMKLKLLGVVQESLERLRRTWELVVVEGAGSPAEINLPDDIANMHVARLGDARVLLVGDVDRGGVFAALVGTMALLDPADRARVGGFVVNKLRGDASLLVPGFDELTARTGVPVLGVVPWIAEPVVPAEDSLSLDDFARSAGREPRQVRDAEVLEVTVVRLPRIANFDDFEPLAREPRVRLRFAATPTELGGADLVVLPGTKSTVADLAWLRERGLAGAVAERVARRQPVLGICGGYQMLGVAVFDPEGVESGTAETAGLGLLPATTRFSREKATVRVRARVEPGPGLFEDAAGAEVAGYEIHAGRTEVGAARRPFTVVARAGAAARDPDGASDPSGVIVGTYLHGLFASAPLRRAVLRHLAARRGLAPDPRWGSPTPSDEGYDRLAEIVKGAVAMEAVAKLVGLEFPRA